MAKVIFHSAAVQEYVEAWAWYYQRSVQAAERFEAEVERILELVKLHPTAFPAFDENHRFAVLRRFLYTLIYQIEDGAVRVIAVAHARREPHYWHGRSSRPAK